MVEGEEPLPARDTAPPHNWQIIFSEESGLVEDLRSIPLFRNLSNVELAKLVPFVERVTLPTGAILDPKQARGGKSVHFIVDGSAELVYLQDSEPVPLMVLSVGDVIGQLLPSISMEPELLRAQTPLTLLEIRTESFHSLCLRNPALGQEVARCATARSTVVYSELARTKRILTAYAKELWYAHERIAQPEPGLQEAAARDLLASQPPPVAAPRPHRLWRPGSLHLSGRAAMGIAMVGALIALQVFQLLHPLPAATMVLVILLWGAANWYLAVIPDYAVAMAMMASAGAMALAPLPIVLSGFTNSAYFLLVGVYGIGAAIQRTGLLYRFTLFMLRKLPPTYGGQTLALSLTGLILTPILPSANGRVTIASPLVKELSSAMRIPDRSPGSSGLLLSALHGFGQMFFLFMSGGTCLVLWGLLPQPYRSEVTWMRWILMAAPLGLLVFLGFLAVLYLIPGARQLPPVSRRMLDTQLATLGPMTSSESSTLIISIFVFLMFAMQPFHHIDSAWPAIIGLVLLLTGGIVDRSSFLHKIDWSYLAFFGAVVGYAELIRYVHLDQGLGNLARVILSSTVHSPAQFLAAIVVLTYLIRIAVPWSASVPLLMLAISPVMVQYGYHPFIGGLAILAASNPFMIPNQNILFLNAHSATSEESITLKTAARYGWAHAAIVLAGVVLSVPVWTYFGWTP